MEPAAHVFRITLATRGYTLGKNAWGFEAHFTAVVPGNIHNVRERLRSLAFPYFQKLVRERYGQDIPLGKIRGEFEREEPALSPSPDILVEPLEMVYRGKIHYAKTLPTHRLPSDIVAYDPDRDSNDDEQHDEDTDDDDDEWEEGDWEDDEEDESYDEDEDDDDY